MGVGCVLGDLPRPMVREPDRSAPTSEASGSEALGKRRGISSLVWWVRGAPGGRTSGARVVWNFAPTGARGSDLEEQSRYRPLLGSPKGRLPRERRHRWHRISPKSEPRTPSSEQSSEQHPIAPNFGMRSLEQPGLTPRCYLRRRAHEHKLVLTARMQKMSRATGPGAMEDSLVCVCVCGLLCAGEALRDCVVPWPALRARAGAAPAVMQRRSHGGRSGTTLTRVLLGVGPLRSPKVSCCSDWPASAGLDIMGGRRPTCGGKLRERGERCEGRRLALQRQPEAHRTPRRTTLFTQE